MLGVHQGVGARAENAKLPAAGRGQYEDAIVTTKYNYAQLYITGQAKEFSTRKAFVDFAMRILKDTKEGLTLDLARQSWSRRHGPHRAREQRRRLRGRRVDGRRRFGVRRRVGLARDEHDVPVQEEHDDRVRHRRQRRQRLRDPSRSRARRSRSRRLLRTRSRQLPDLPPRREEQRNRGLAAGGRDVGVQTSVLGLGTSVYHNIDRSGVLRLRRHGGGLRRRAVADEHPEPEGQAVPARRQRRISASRARRSSATSRRCSRRSRASCRRRSCSTARRRSSTMGSSGRRTRTRRWRR
jgi:hypothetical protein